MKILTLTLVPLLWYTSAYAETYADFSKKFQCPESFVTEKDRDNALQKFLTWAQKQYTDLTIEKIVELRMKLLKEHNCSKTLANIQNSPQVKSSDRYQCLKNNGGLYFSNIRHLKCKEIPLDPQWENLLIQDRFIVEINPSKIIKESDGVKIWARFYLAQPLSGGSFKYNYVQSITKYFCSTKQQLLIQGSYLLNGEIQKERLSNESVMEEIEPDTISEEIFNYVCK